MAKLRKGGPRRKEGARNNRGRLVAEEDPGTAELLAQKFAATGSTREEISALGVLRGRKILDEDHYQAGLEFERCYRAYIGRPDPRASSFERQARGGMLALDETYLMRMKIRYWNYFAALGQVGPHAFALVRDVCLYERAGGLMGQVIAFDVVRSDGALISRKEKAVPPGLRLKIAALVRGLEALDYTPRANYSPEASKLIQVLQAGAAAQRMTTIIEDAGRSDSA